MLLVFLSDGGYTLDILCKKAVFYLFTLSAFSFS